MAHDLGAICLCIATHNPAPMELVEHHIWPLYLGGPDEPWNLVWLCPTTHYNVHEMLRLWLKVGPLTWGEQVAVTEVPLNRYAYRIARHGYLEWKDTQPIQIAP